MAYKFQKGTAQLSGTIKLDSGYDLTGAGSNDIGTSAAPFAIAYASIVSASTVVSGAFFEGDGSRLTEIAATNITTTGTSTDATYYPLFVDTAAGESDETIRVHSTVSINPNKGKVEATIFSSSAQVDVGGALTLAGVLNVQSGSIVNAGVIEATSLTSSGGLTVDSITVGQSYSIANDGDAVLASLNNSSGGITNAGSIAGATTISGSGVLSVGAGVTLAGVLNVQSGSIVNAGVVEVTSLTGSGAVTVGSITLGQAYSISNEGAAVLASLNNSSGGITNAGSIAGATTVAMGGALTGATTISGSGLLSIGAGATLAGVLNVQSGSIVNAGAVEATSLNAYGAISGSGAVTADSLTLAEAYSISNAGAAVLASINVSDGNITNVGEISVDKISTDSTEFELDISGVTTGQANVKMADNLNEAFYFNQAGNNYLVFQTTNDDECVKTEQDFIVGKSVNSGKFLMLNGGIDFKGQKTLTASVNLDEDGESGVYHYQSHYIVSGSSAVVVQLPSLENGYSLWFKRHPDMTNDVTIAPSGSTNLIDGVNDPVVLETAGASMQLVGSGSLNWYIY